MAAPQLFSGNGAPNGVVFADPGDLYMNMAGGTGTTFYVKESGVATSVGWVAYTSAATVQQAAAYYNDFYTDLGDVESFLQNGASVYGDDPQTYGFPPNTAGILVLDTSNGPGSPQAGAEVFTTLTSGTLSFVLGHGVFDFTYRAAVTMTLAGAPNGATDYKAMLAVNPAINDPGGDPGLQFIAGINLTGNTHWWACVGAIPNASNVDTGVAVVADGMHTFRVVYDSTLATPSAKFYIDGVLVATITTSLPVNLSADRAMAIYNSTLVANTPKLIIDYVTLTYTFATPR